MPTISIIVPNYNHARFLRQRIGSILGQTYQDFELILLDDSSADNSRDVLRNYTSDPRVRLIFNGCNSGNTYRQWNKGVRLARGKYVWIAESDDYADARFLERMISDLDNNSGVLFACCRSRLVDESNAMGGFVDVHLGYDVRRWAADFCEGGRDACRDLFLSYNPVGNASAVVFRKDAYERIGGADETLRYCADWKLWAAMALEGKLAYTSEPLNYYRFHQQTVRSKNSGTVQETAEVLGVLCWFVEKGLFSEVELRRVRDAQAEAWVPALLSRQTPVATKRLLMQRASAFDPFAPRRVLGGLATAARLKVRQYWQRSAGLRRYGNK